MIVKREEYEIQFLKLVAKGMKILKEEKEKKPKCS